jgi:hypothetical protein
LLSIETPHELEEYMGEVLDLSVAVNKAFVQELLSKRWRTAVDTNSYSKQLPAEGMVLLKKLNSQVINYVILVHLLWFDRNCKYLVKKSWERVVGP